MSEIKELQKILADFCNDRDWKQFHNPKDVAISLLLESGELLEHFQWKNSSEITEHVALKKSEIADELADVFYWVLLLASDLDIDLADSLKKKIEKNAAKYPVHKARGTHKKYSELSE